MDKESIWEFQKLEDFIKLYGIINKRNYHEMDMPVVNQLPGYSCSIYLKNGIITLEEQDFIKVITIGLEGGYEQWKCLFEKTTHKISKIFIQLERISKTITFNEFLKKFNDISNEFEKNKVNFLRKKLDWVFEDFLNIYFPLPVIEFYNKEFKYHNLKEQKQYRLDKYKNVRREFYIKKFNDSINYFKKLKNSKIELEFITFPYSILNFNSILELKEYLIKNSIYNKIKSFLQENFSLNIELIIHNDTIYMKV